MKNGISGRNGTTRPLGKEFLKTNNTFLFAQYFNRVKLKTCPLWPRLTVPYMESQNRKEKKDKGHHQCNGIIMAIQPNGIESMAMLDRIIWSLIKHNYPQS